MEFLSDLFWAILMVGLPVAAFTMAIVWWGFQRGAFQESMDTRALEREIKAMKKRQKKTRAKGENGSGSDMLENTRKPHFVEKKWAKFGGGFYGIVGLFTWIVIECLEIIEMISNFGGLWEFLKNFSVQVMINILIGALSNFIAALVWPLYWMKRIDAANTWVWFVVAYGGYWSGLKLAQFAVQRKAAIKN